MERIESTNNRRLKEWRKLTLRKYRRERGGFLIEGVHLVEEAINAGAPIEEWMMTQSCQASEEGHLLLSRLSESYPEASSFLLADHLSDQLSTTPAPQGVFALITLPTSAQMLERFKHFLEDGDEQRSHTPHLLLLDRVQDPGNLGTLIRTADAAGFAAVVIGEGSVDLYNDKVIRATQGSLFHLPLFPLALEEVLPLLKGKEYQLWATDLKEAQFHHQMAVPERVALILGNEGAGVDERWIEAADCAVKIPIFGAAESLNVAVAGAVLLYYLALN